MKKIYYEKVGRRYVPVAEYEVDNGKLLKPDAMTAINHRKTGSYY
jgi:hypothetical protein